ncbi:transcriptional regulator [Pedobacter lusitanus]|uniref:Transcriptional regulator n=1 Tax=Pedobacter lusitanus TaxID=1503925 RepID=A0A0D0GJW2_9SPHI|nr:helix-turn-helix transcriptional regulator [Pedobacter lusitanus]KIO77557.1 transcriptional regulator [Pedobacter lusitanus]
MKPQLLKISKSPAQSFSVRHDWKPNMNNKFHYHPEAELIHFVKGKGSQFIGDSISEFQSGDLILVGANLPHYWRFDEDFTATDSTNYADLKVVHFSEKFLGEHFLNLPENKSIRDILDKARRGIRIEGKNKKNVTEILGYMLKTEGTDRIIYMIQALLEIAKCDKLELLSSVGYSSVTEDMGNDRIKDVYDYTFANFRNRIELKEIADVARISPNSFCRYFKSFTQKTYSQFLTEIKVGQACKLLIDNRLNIKQVCYESGFNNFTSFHKCFKGITGKSPLSYQREFTAS